MLLNQVEITSNIFLDSQEIMAVDKARSVWHQNQIKKKIYDLKSTVK